MNAADSHDDLPGYEVLDFIGRGGMGTVCKARQASLDRIVAIKLLPRELVRDDIDFAARFKQEAQTMAKLSHPGIVAVHDFGQTGDGRLFFAMEFIDGQDLAKIIEQRGALNVDEALRVFRLVAEALVYAHGEGVVHRDIKPANVLIKSNGEVKVADFGLAKLTAPGTVALTATSTSMGSHDFAAPEVFVHGGNADHRADIYSLGVMLYQMLTGVIPRGMFKLPSERVPSLGTAFDEIVCTALEQDREDRYQTADEMLQAIGQPSALTVAVAPSEATTLPVALVRRQLHWRRVALAVATAIVLGFAGQSIWHGWDDGKVVADPQGPADAAKGPWHSMLTSDGGKLRRSLQGNWSSNNGSLIGPPATAVMPELCGLSLSSTESCDLRFRLTKTEGEDGLVHFAFRHAIFSGSIVFSDRQARDSTSFVGLARLDGKAAEKDSTWVKQRQTAFLTIGQIHEVLLQVRDEGVVVLLDGAEVYRWAGDWSRTEQHHPLFNAELTKVPVYAVGTYKARVALHTAEYRLVKGDQGRSLPPAPSGSGEWQDVLAQLDITKHRRAGRWKLVDGKLANEDNASGSVMELPISAPGASDLRIKLTRLTPGSGAVTIGFHIGDRGGEFVISDYSHPRAGLDYIDGKSITTNGVHVEQWAAYLTLGHPHEVLLRLRDEGMTASLDGVEIYRWKGDWSRVTQDGGWLPEAMIGKNAFAISSRLGRIEVKEIAFRKVGGDEAKTLPAGTPSTPPVPKPMVFPGNGHRYQFVPGQFTWNEAEANARSVGGHLVTLTTQEEHDWVWQTFSPWLPSHLASSYRTRGWWIGGLITPDKEWKWVTAEPLEFNRADKNEKTEARVPRLFQHDNGGGRMSLWRQVHYSTRFGYVVEWEEG